MNLKRLKRRLRRVVGPKAFLDDPASLAAYSYDSSLQTAAPDFVLFPGSTEHVAQIVTLLRDAGVPYVARGAGTNLSGGSIPVKGGAVIALARMRRILSIDPENFCARVEPGLTNLALQETLASRRFFFAPDPASQKVSTLGGNVAENSGGPHCLKYGVTTNHILGVRLVTPGGELVELGGESLDSPGMDLLGLLVGSEGTLGIVTQIICRILPIPESVKTMLAIFDSTEQAVRTVSDIIAARILPATLEMMDNLIIRAVEESLHAGYPTDAEAVLIIEIDGPREGLDETAAEIERICGRNGVREVRTARDERERAQLWAGRRGAFGAVARLFPNYSVSDGTVPRTRLPDALRRVSEIGRKYDLKIGNVFHAGDGNLHPLIFFDSRDAQQLEKVHRAGEEILEACIEAGGTITGEHGVGLEKVWAMPKFFGPAEIELMRRIKNAFDPAGLCNPGKILPEPVPAADRRDAIAESEDAAPFAAADSFRGVPKYSPSSATELVALVRQMREEKKTFAPIGAETVYPGLPLRRMPDALIQTTRMRKIVEHDAANLTATVQAGLPIGDLQETLARAGQFLPLDAPANATVGGAAASALSGPRRHFYGAARDLVLGLRFVSSDGRILRAGGKTVKNVAGYDFGKLLIGSWGALGVITEITFRLLPLPRARGAVIAGFESAGSAHAAAVPISGSGLDPAMVTLLNEDAASRLWNEFAGSLPSGRCVLVLGAEGFPQSVERQLAEFERICGEHGARASVRMNDDGYGSLLAGINDSCYAAREPKSRLSIRITAPCRDAIKIVERIEGLGAECADALQIAAHMPGGLVCAHFSLVSDGASGAARKILETLGGLFPGSSIMTLGVWGGSIGNAAFLTGSRSPAVLQKEMKKCFDPEGLLVAGMFEW